MFQEMTFLKKENALKPNVFETNGFLRGITHQDSKYYVILGFF